MIITQETRKAIYDQNCSKVFCNIMKIEHDDLENPLRFIDNTQGIVFGGYEYEPRGFDFTPPAPQSEDAAANISIDDTDRVLARAFQSIGSGCAILSICLIRADDPDVVMDGPYRYKVTGFRKASATGQATLALSRLMPLDANASGTKYTAMTFPGLYG
ncbi:MAG: DUF1833 family protein [Spirochaetales bacterium]|nr:DUF1833 family protein [Spirochaetales bacterium]